MWCGGRRSEKREAKLERAMKLKEAVKEVQ
jgi:hypothetical protein